MTDRYVCIHGHFYQPPRENPWLEAVELQDSAYPYHDWNERITAECYAPNFASRILDADKRVTDIVNNYSRISFDFGPTLLSWLEHHKPNTYQAILDADRMSLERFSGHGCAIAQAYSHMIMPLASRRDKVTQILWGMRDFQKRFGRSPEGMWLPETAVDMETLDVMAGFGIKFTLLAPRQARRVRKMVRSARWHDVSGGRIDPTTAYRCVLPSRKSIVLFFYDGPLSQELAFGELLNSGESFSNRLLSVINDSREWPQLVHVATDGETYGHHRRYGDMALAYCLRLIESSGSARLTNYGEYLERHPPTHWVEVYDRSSWSCIHGIERWKEDCGCNSGTHSGWNQAWRKPLRDAMDWLRDTLAPLYEDQSWKWLTDPWKARDGYIDVVLDRRAVNVEEFFRRNAVGALSREEKVKALKYLEMQRNAMLMYTSCGWFFDEISGIETTQVLRYAARAIQLAEELFEMPLEKDFLQKLEGARSNIPEFEHGAKIYDMFVRPSMLDLPRVGAHYAISSLFEDFPKSARIYCYTATSDRYDGMEMGKLRLAVGKTRITSEVTWEEEPISFAVLHLGDHNLNGGVRKFMGDDAFSAMHGEIKESFSRGNISDVIKLMDKHFGTNNYSLWHLFRDEQRKVLNQMLRPILEGIVASFRKVYEENYPIMSFLQGLGMPLPGPYAAAAGSVVNSDMRRMFEEGDMNLERLERLIKEAERWSLEIDKKTIGFAATSWINSVMEKLQQQQDGKLLFETMERVLDLMKSLSVEPDLWQAQNACFSIGKALLTEMQERAARGDASAKSWAEVFQQLCFHLRVKVGE